jgi:hemolysin activation/secretion protein
VANKHPSKQIQLTFKQSETEDKVDANIKVVEQPRPYQFSLGFNNTGSDSSGEYRLTGGAQYSNLWGLDHVVNASYTLPPDHADTIKQYGGTYALPIYALKSWVNMYYASSSSNNGVVATDLTITGAGEMMGIHYQQFLPKFEKYEHSLDIGIDSKYFINDVQFKKTQVGTNVRSLPFSISYKAEYPFEYVRSGYFVQWAINTGLGSDNNDLLYSKSRAGSDSSWQLFRYGTNFSTSYEQWSLSTSLTGQFSQKPLIAGEQVGIGGSYDVRGYEQRETGADNGQIVKVELTSPAWEKINAFVFYDYGHGSKEKPQAGELKDWNLSGTGIGTRWQWREYVNASLTFATALNDATTTRAFNNRLLLNVNVRY